jgi:hypothetical protein
MTGMVNQAAFDIGQMIERVADGYYTHVAAIQIAGDPRRKGFISPWLDSSRGIRLSQRWDFPPFSLQSLFR